MVRILNLQQDRNIQESVLLYLEDGADAAKVEEEIKNMPNYFADYDTTVHFISEEELKAEPQRNSTRWICNPFRKDRLESGK